MTWEETVLVISKTSSLTAISSKRKYNISFSISTSVDCIYNQLNYRAINENIVLVSRAFRRQFVIPEFEEFTDKIEKFYWKCKDLDGGKVRGVRESSVQ